MSICFRTIGCMYGHQTLARTSAIYVRAKSTTISSCISKAAVGSTLEHPARPQTQSINMAFAMAERRAGAYDQQLAHQRSGFPRRRSGSRPERSFWFLDLGNPSLKRPDFTVAPEQKPGSRYLFALNSLSPPKSCGGASQTGGDLSRRERKSATHLSQSSAPPCTRRKRRPSPWASVPRSALACWRRRCRRAQH
jgi:hypothetical protein